MDIHTRAASILDPETGPAIAGKAFKQEISNQHDKDERTGDPLATVAHQSSVEEGQQLSAPLVLLHDKKVEEALKTDEPIQGSIPEEVRQIMEAGHPEREGHLLNPAHFIQKNGRQGATIYVPNHTDANGDTVNRITFDQGMFSSTDVRTVTAIRKAINRPGGISNVIKEVTADHYKNLLTQAGHAQRLRQSNGLLSTADTLKGKHQPTQEMLDENARLKEELEAMRSQVVSLQENANAAPKQMPQAVRNPASENTNTDSEEEALQASAVNESEDTPKKPNLFGNA